MRRRNKLRVLAKKISNSDIWGKYKSIRNEVTSALRNSKQDYFASLITKSSKDKNKCWKKLNALLGRGAGLAPLLEVANPACLLNDHFNKSTPTCCLPQCSVPYLPFNFDFNEISEEEVRQALSNLNINKATGPDGISAKLLKLTAPAICHNICELFNASLITATVPTEWKTARIIPVPKSSKAASVNDFRPISILPVMAKVFESLVYSQVSKFVDQYSILHSSQSGFRPHHSTQDVLLVFTVDDWRRRLEHNEIVGSVFVDLSKAFDSIPHSLLLEKLCRYGFRGQSLKWLQSYLHDRKQHVFYNDESSPWSTVNMGVPQGSILGPLLFSLFINDLPTSLGQSSVMLYADDTTVYFSDPDGKVVQNVLSEDLGRLSTWIIQNGLNLNLHKTQFLCLARKNKVSQTKDIAVSMGGTTLQRQNEVKFLGVIVDERLSWRSHIEKIKRSCLRAMSPLFKLRNTLPSNLKLMLYRALVEPHLNYCAVVWMECSKADRIKLEKIQNRAMRVILNERKDSSATRLRSQLGWSTLENRRKMLRAVCTKRYLSKECPAYSKGMFMTNKDVGIRSARRLEDIQ